MMTITSNERFEIRSLDFKNAYLQGSKIGRTVYIEPPSDYKKEGKIWLILRNVYGTNDSTRSFYLSMNETLKKLGGKQVAGDEALYTFHNEKGKLIGMVGLHVNNLYIVGNKEFMSKVGEPLKKRYVFGKEETKKFRFTGLDIEQMEAGIEVNQAKYCEAIQEIYVPDKKKHRKSLE